MEIDRKELARLRRIERAARRIVSFIGPAPIAQAGRDRKNYRGSCGNFFILNGRIADLAAALNPSRTNSKEG